MLPSDSSEEVLRTRYTILRRLGMADRARMAIELSDGLRALVESGVRMRHPDYDNYRVRLAVLRIALGERLFSQAYPDMEIAI